MSPENSLGGHDRRGGSRASCPRLAALAWLALWGLAVWLARPFHPTLTIDVLATLVLVAFYALAATVNQIGLAGRPLLARLPLLLAAEVGLTAAAVEAIQGVYALLWHPDPRRFGFWFNFASDFAGMNLVVAMAAAAAWITKRRALRAPARTAVGLPPRP